MKGLPGWPEAFARLLLSLLFLFRAGYMLVLPGRYMNYMVQSGLVAIPFIFVVVLSLLILGGLGLLLGYRTKIAAVLLMFYAILNLIIAPSGWNFESLSQVFLWLVVIGGLLLVIIHGPGTWSFDKHNLVPVRRRN